MISRARLAVWTLPLAYLLAGPLIHGGFWLNLMTLVLTYAVFAMSMDLLVGFAGMVSLGHAAFFGMGAYATGILLELGWRSEYLVLPAALLVTALLALLLGRLSVGTSGVSFIMVTLALSQLVYHVALNSPWTGSTDGLILSQRPTLSPLPLNLEDPRHFYYYSLGWALIVLAGLRRLVDSPFGRVAQGIRVNESRMESLGYNTQRYQLTAFIIAGTLAGLGGHLFAILQNFIDPTSLTWQVSGQVLVMVVLGGLGTLHGAALGAFAFILLEQWISRYTQHWMLPLGVFLVAMVLSGRGGIMALLQRLTARFRP
ncbi:MAG: branched-chain amino acid ABC transporter permease [Deltaproteobacteria bacterium]|nr:branched-chain amino acid ABC transporter permease [Deltaproteobacteria bacterium]